MQLFEDYPRNITTRLFKAAKLVNPITKSSIPEPNLKLLGKDFDIDTVLIQKCKSATIRGLVLTDKSYYVLEQTVKKSRYFYIKDIYLINKSIKIIGNECNADFNQKFFAYTFKFNQINDKVCYLDYNKLISGRSYTPYKYTLNRNVFITIPKNQRLTAQFKPFL